MEVHSRVEFQWKFILEWNLRVELNGDTGYGLPYKYIHNASLHDKLYSVPSSCMSG